MDGDARSSGVRDGKLVENLMHFGRLLRACGLPIGSGQLVSATEAVRVVGIEDRTDFYWTLHAILVDRSADREIFDRAFRVFWTTSGLPLPFAASAGPDEEADPRSDSEFGRRLADALAAGAGPQMKEAPPPGSRRADLDAVLTWSSREVLRSKDFEEMSEEEIAKAKAAVAALRPHLPLVSTRRHCVHPRGRRVDMRATLRAALRAGTGGIPLVRARQGTKPAPIVLICDISGSMSRYSSLLLHFAHALATARERVHAFVFGTRLTNITRHLRERDPDAALEEVSRVVADWSGGTRIGRCLHEFNRAWSRRVLGPGALVLLVTDGLDRDIGQGLAFEMERLRKSCRRLLWLNPLLRYSGFEPRARGMQAMLPFVHEMRTVHNLDSLEVLCEVLSHSRMRAARATHFVSGTRLRAA